MCRPAGCMGAGDGRICGCGDLGGGGHSILMAGVL
jgi:hypothetical protein